MANAVPSANVSDPNRVTLLDLRKDVVSMIQGGEDPRLLDQAGKAINSAIHMLNSHDWHWNLKSQTIVSVSGDSGVDYTIQDSVKRPRMLIPLDSDGWECGKLGYLEPKEFMETYTSNDNGSPQAYTIFSRHNFGTLSLSHRPTTEWVSSFPSMRFWYWAYVRELDALTDTLDTPSQFIPVVTWYAKAQMAIHSGEARFADMARREWRDALKQLKFDDLDRQTDISYDSPFEYAAQRIYRY